MTLFCRIVVGVFSFTGVVHDGLGVMGSNLSGDPNHLNYATRYGVDGTEYEEVVGVEMAIVVASMPLCV